MENLDDLMRKKFASDDPAGRFEFREEFWEQAQVLIETDEAQRKKRKRRILWWWFLCAGLALGCWQLAEWSSRREHSTEQSRQTTDTQDDIGAAGAKTQPASDDKHASTAGSGQPASGVLDKDTPATPQPRVTNSTNNTPDNQQHTTNSKDQSAGRRTKGQSGPTPPASPKDKGNSIKKGADTTPPTSTAPQAFAPPGSNNDNTGNSHAAEAVGKPGPQNNASGVPATGTDSSVVQTTAPDAVMSPAGLLPTLSGLLDLPQRSPDLPGVVVENTAIKPHRESKWRFGIEASGSFGQASLDNKRWGASAGIVAQRRLSPALSVSTGIRWRYLAGAWARDTTPGESAQLRYGFGFVHDEWNLRSRGQHLLEVPLALRWKRNQLALEAGVSAGWLAGVRGELVQRHSESLQSGVRIDKSGTWLSTAPFYRFVPGIFAGAEWNPIRRMGITIEGNWRPGRVGPVLNPDAPPPPANLLRLDAGLRWYF